MGDPNERRVIDVNARRRIVIDDALHADAAMRTTPHFMRSSSSSMIREVVDRRLFMSC